MPGQTLDLLQRDLEDLGTGSLLVVTGAGVSSASGIATFRGPEPGAVWKQDDISLATHDYFQRDPAGQWRWYLQRFAAVEGADPNEAHRSLAELERWHRDRGGQFLLVTQNIDTLHEEAGSQKMVKIHGTSDRVRCSRPGCPNGAPSGSLPRSAVDFASFESDPTVERLPTCPVCDEYLRAHVLFFDEYYQEHQDYRFDEVGKAAGGADLVLFAGTSFSVGITDLVMQSALARDVPVYSVDPQAHASAPSHLRQIALPAEEALPRLCRTLVQQGSDTDSG